MLIEMRGENTGSVVMFGNVAVQLLKMMGMSGNTEGAIQQPDIPEALAALKVSLSNLPAESTQRPDDDDGEAPVGLSTRAKPLIDLLEECTSKGGYFMWKPQ